MEAIDLLSPDDIVTYKNAGVQDGVFKKLRLGKYEIQARLDLHQKNLIQARNSVTEFVRVCIKLDIRSAIIIHGRGAQSDPPAVLKSYVSLWLPQFEDVLAIHSTQRHHGGAGSLYVLFKKSPANKIENREHQTKGKG